MRSGVTPVVAIVLLLMMTVATSGAVYTYITSTVQGAQEDASGDLATRVVAKDVACGRSVVAIGLKNQGGTDIATGEADLYIYREGDLVTARTGLNLSGLSLAPDDFAWARLLTDVPLNRSTTYTVELSFPRDGVTVSQGCDGFVAAGASGVWTFDDGPDHRFIAYQADNSPLAYQYVYDNGTVASMQTFGADYTTSNTDGGIVAADITGDGMYDIVHGNEGNPDGGQNLYLWTNVRDVPPTSPERIATLPNGDGNFQGITTGDFDNDGDIEIVAVSGCCDQSPTYMVNSTAAGWTATELSSSMVARDVVSADFDEDGCEDLVGGSNNDVSFWPGRCNGTFDSPTVISSLGDDNYLAEGDFDGDGNMDVMINPQTNGSINLYTGNGAGSFTYDHRVYDTNAHIGLDGADVDRDGDRDLVGCIHKNGGAVVSDDHAFTIENTGGGTFATPVDQGDTGDDCIGAAFPQETFALDAAGSHHGLIRGARWVDGRSGDALSFDGLDDLVRVPDDRAFDIGSGDLTVVAWAKVPSGYAPSNHRFIVEKAVKEAFHTNDGPGWGMAMDQTGDPYGVVTDAAGSTQWTAGRTGEDARDDTWRRYVVVVRNGDEIAFYRDGVEEDAAAIPAVDFNASTDLGIGASVDGSHRYMDAVIDEVQVYPYAVH